jgi:hypothetical protein
MRARPHTTGRNLTGALALGLALALLAAVPAEAQYFRFGKNKVQYRALDWHYLQTEHFDVYYYEPGGEALAAFTAEAAEDAYARIAALFDYRLTYRVPLLVYQSHNDFAVTNAMNLPAFAEGIGGATEPFKNRVALPFTGDYREYRRVLHHELVHAVTNDMLFGGTVQRLLQGGQRVRLPLWFSEGLAEYAAFGWDSHSDMYLREAVLGDHLEPIPELYGYFAYRGGQGVFDYLAAQYGREKITELMRYLQAGASVEGAIRQGTGMDLDALSERWHAALRAAYFPEAAAREDLDAIARPLASAEGGARYYAGATISPQGDRVAFLAARGALFDVYVVDASGERRPRRLVQGQTRPEFESFRILTPSLSWDPSGDRLAVAVKAGALGRHRPRGRPLRPGPALPRPRPRRHPLGALEPGRPAPRLQRRPPGADRPLPPRPPHHRGPQSSPPTSSPTSSPPGARTARASSSTPTAGTTSRPPASGPAPSTSPATTTAGSAYTASASMPRSGSNGSPETPTGTTTAPPSAPTPTASSSSPTGTASRTSTSSTSRPAPSAPSRTSSPGSPR